MVLYITKILHLFPVEIKDSVMQLAEIKNTFVTIWTPFPKEVYSIDISYCYCCLWRIKFEMVSIATKHENKAK